MTTSNIFILASDNSPKLLPILRANPSLASSQDSHGYSLLHAAASYNHYDLLRTLIHELHVDPNIKDEDSETPLFAAETVEAAQILAESQCDLTAKNHEGLTAEEKIRTEGDFVVVADYLKEQRMSSGDQTSSSSTTKNKEVSQRPPPLPPNVSLNVGTTTEDEVPEEVDTEFRAKIEELAAREDFRGEEGQRQLRELVTEAVRGVERDAEGGGGGGRDVRRRV